MPALPNTCIVSAHHFNTRQYREHNRWGLGGSRVRRSGLSSISALSSDCQVSATSNGGINAMMSDDMPTPFLKERPMWNAFCEEVREIVWLALLVGGLFTHLRRGRSNLRARSRSKLVVRGRPQFLRNGR